MSTKHTSPAFATEIVRLNRVLASTSVRPLGTRDTFKRVALGVTFTDAQASSVTKGQRFRKASEKGAVKLLDDPLRAGRGQTHARVAFARSHSVAI